MARFSPIADVLWRKTAPPSEITEDLREDREADICIVGGGFCGLYTALNLARDDRKVVVLEAEEIGFGGSGRNAGHCTPTFHHHSLDGVRKLLGEKRGEQLIELQLGAADRIAEIIRKYGIECEWVQNGYVMAAPTREKLRALQAKVDSYNQAGQSTYLADAGEVRRLTGMEGQYGGWVHPGGAHLNPMGLSRGLARAARDCGAQLFVRSPAIQARREGRKWHVSTPKASVIADRIIYATGAYTQAGWPRLEKSFRIMRVVVAATRPLPDAVEILPQNVTAHDGRGNILVYKRDAFGRIVASMFPRLFGGRERMIRLLTRRLQYHHPSLPQTIEWDCLWTGELDMQERTIPRLYRLGEGAVAVTGLSGRGVPTGYTVGQVLADWARGAPEGHLPLPVEPLRSSSVYMAFGPQLALRGYEMRDRLAEWRSGQPMRPW